MPRPFVTAVALAGAFLAPTAAAEVRLHPLFQDHMVLQRDAEVAVWGEATPFERVVVRGSWSNAAATAIAGADGRFLARLETGPAGGPYSLTVEGSSATTLEDVLLGDVWLCSGQSNMEMGFRWHAGVDDAERELAAAYRPRIRLFDVERRFSPGPVEDVRGTWSVCAPRTVADFSAAAYFFAREIQRHVPVPIGLIGANWGGTRCEAWTSRETLAASFPEFADALALSRRLAEHPERARAEEEGRRTAWWRRLAELDGGETAADPRHDDSSWTEVTLPGPWEDSSIGAFDGVAWFRRAFELPASRGGTALVLALGPIDDVDTTWWNGLRIGGHEAPGAHETLREYAVPAELVRPGRNVVAVRVVDFGGAGGFTGDLHELGLRAADEANETVLPLAGRWRARRGPDAAALSPFPSGNGFHPNSPAALYQGMIAPLVPFGLKGVIWYQGESNRLEAAQYRRLFPAMIADWRRAFGQGDFPFYFVQIAPYRYAGDTGQAAELREAQLLALDVPGTGMACTMDVGSADDIHPTNKQAVGRRLARWALARTYGIDVPYSGPLYRGLTVEAGAIRVSFDHANGLRTRDGAAPSHFTVAGADGVFHAAAATIDGETVVVRSAAVEAPAAVRYAWGAADAPNLENGDGLPASSFRTDGPARERTGS